MKIEKIRVYQVDMPLKEGDYRWSDGKSISTFDTSVVEVVTDAGITGYGEVCPLGSSYMVAYANGVRAGIKEIGSELIGENPLEIGKLNDRMDYLLKGHPYVKSGIDIACWDILGKLPVCTLLGGRYGESVKLYRSVCHHDPVAMREKIIKYKAEGYKKFQIKLSGNPDVDIECVKASRAALDDEDTLSADVNTGYLPHQALRVANAIKDLDVYLEQPCATYSGCLTVRQHTNLPMVLDESIDSMQAVVRAISDRAADYFTLKLSRLGGITKLKQARDLCVSMGITMCLEDSWGGDIITATSAHIAHSTPEKYRFSTSDLNEYNTVKIAHGAPERMNGEIKASDKRGLGIEPIMDVLGMPVVDV